MEKKKLLLIEKINPDYTSCVKELGEPVSINNKIIENLSEHYKKQYYDTLNGKNVNSTNKELLYKVRGPFLQTEVVNGNKRFYRLAMMERIVANYVKKMINIDHAVGELNHSQSAEIDPNNVSHKIISLTRIGNDFIGEAIILDTPKGLIVKRLIDGDVRVATSSRGTGSIEEKNGIYEVCDDFDLATPSDIVFNPSAPDGFLERIMEKQEWPNSFGESTIRVNESIADKVELASRNKRQLSEKEIQDMFATFINSIEILRK